VKIALLAPFEEVVPPPKYGGTELVVANLADELVELGHDVTLFASGDSTTKARIIPSVEKAIRSELAHNPRTWSYLQWQGFHNIVQALETERYDIIHNHCDWPFLIIDRLVRTAPIITTIHNPVQFSHGVPAIYERYPYVSISKAQRRTIPELNYLATVYNGIRVESFELSINPGKYLAFLGRLSPDKGPEQAIEIAKRTGQKLVMAGKVDPPERHYFQKVLKPLIDGKQIQFIGEVDHPAKVELLKNAKALLSPIQWDEPFGLTNIEAMACGTPVLALRRGALPELIIDKQTGFLCRNVDEMVRRVADIPSLDRAACRQHVEKHFTASQMAKGYLKVYEKLIKQPALAKH